MPLRQRVELIAKEVYGADGVDWAPLATQKAERFESDPKYKDYCTMMVKTHLSLSDDPTKKGVPTGWRLAIRDILEYGGAKFLCPMAGTISMMPGTAANPAYRRIDVDTETGKVSAGLLILTLCFIAPQVNVTYRQAADIRRLPF